MLVLRGAGLSGRLSARPIPRPSARRRCPCAASSRAPPARPSWSTRSSPRRGRLLADAAPANMILLRGFDQLPELPRFPEVYGLRAAAIAAYPMYRGLAKLVGMDVLKTGGTFADEIATLREHWQAYDFFFVHYKDTDKAGEDGDFDAKVAGPRALRRLRPRASATLGPDVLIVSGDHATPSVLAAHGWQPVPALVLEPLLRRRSRHGLHRAGVRRRHPRTDPRPPPDADRHGQRPAADQVRGVSCRRHAVPDPSPRRAVAGDARRQRGLRVSRGAGRAAAPGRRPAAPGRPGRRRRARGQRAAGGPGRADRLRARPDPLRPAGPRHRHLRRLRLA